MKLPEISSSSSLPAAFLLGDTTSFQFLYQEVGIVLEVNLGSRTLLEYFPREGSSLGWKLRLVKTDFAQNKSAFILQPENWAR